MRLDRKLLLATSMMAGFTALTPAIAAAADQPSAVQEVVVTGSRIPRPNQNSPAEVQVIDAKAIESTGEVNVGAILETLPQMGVSALTPTNSNFLTRFNGDTTINLRNLGTNRTLVLVNGRRYTPGLPGSEAVNFNSIPTEFIDRIDVVTGGASSIYGSDALAGVVNIITQKHYNGFELFGQGGETQYGDLKTSQLGVKFGSDFADGRGNFMGTLSYDNNGSVYAHNRCDEDMCVDGLGGAFFGTDFRHTSTPFFSGFIPGGVDLIPRPNGASNLQRVDNAGTVVPFVSSTMGFNRQAERLLFVPNENLKFSAQANYEIAPWANFFLETTYYQGHNSSNIEPDPLGSNTLYRDPSTGAKLNPSCVGSGAAEVCNFGVPLGHLDGLGNFVPNASVPGALITAVEAANPSALPQNLVVGFQRRLSDFGDRHNVDNNHLFRLVFGLEGDINDKMHYEVSANYGRVEDNQSTFGQINWQRAISAVDSIDLGGGNIVCRDPNARAQGCAPWNPFLPNTATPAVVKYLSLNNSYAAYNQQFILNGYVTGELFSTPAGPAKYSFGLEYRKEESDNLPDPTIQAGISDVNISPETKGSFHVTEEFAELRIPLIANQPLIEHLDLNLSARESQYSSVGETTAWAASLEYQPIDSMKFRGQYARAVRAPNIAELFSGAGETFPTVVDPCAGLTLSGGNPAFFNNPSNSGSGVNPATINSNVAKACIGDPNVAARVARDGFFIPTQPELQGVDGFNSGNPTLKQETSRTISFGWLFNPKWNDWWTPLSVSVDYYDIEVDNAIAFYPRSTELTNCYAGPTFNPANVFCGFITRFTPGTANVGALRLVNAQAFNIATLKQRGVDIQGSYTLDLNRLGGGSGDLGRLTGSVVYSHLFSSTQDPFVGAPVLQLAGSEGFPKDRAQINLLYSRGPLQATWQTNIIGTECFFGPPANCTNEIDGKIGLAAFSNTQVRYNFGPKTTFYVGVNNVFNEFIRIGQGQGQPTGWTTDPNMYDGVGRRWYVGFNQKF